MTREYVLDGPRITSLDAFYDEVSNVLVPGRWWGRNLDAFDDILRGGFGTPKTGFILRWQHADVSRAALGPSIFDRLIDIIREHGPGGEQSEDKVELILD